MTWRGRHDQAQKRRVSRHLQKRAEFRRTISNAGGSQAAIASGGILQASFRDNAAKSQRIDSFMPLAALGSETFFSALFRQFLFQFGVLAIDISEESNAPIL